MNAADYDIAKFSAIQEIYSFLDKNAYEFERKKEITDLWIEYRNKTTDLHEKQLAQWELECFLFHIIGKDVFAFSYSTGEKPEDVYQYPRLDDYQSAAFEYVKQRAKDTSSPVLKARYNHLLWKSIKGIKNSKYAKAAVDSYVEVVKYYTGLLNNSDEEITSQITKWFEALVSVVHDSKYRTAEAIDISKGLLFNNTVNIKFYIRHSILETMLDFPGVFKKETFENTLSLFEEDIKLTESGKSDDHLMAKYYLPTAIKIASKIGEDSRKWYTKIGEFYVRTADKENDPERNWIKLQFYSSAIQNFRQAGDTAKRQQAEEKYAALKEEVTLPTVEVPYDDDHIKHLNEMEEEIKGKTEILLEQPPDIVYEFITKGSFFPTLQFLRERGGIKTEPWMQGITTVKFDRNKNIESVSSEDNGEDWMFSYKYYLRHVVNPYLYYVFIPGIQSGVLTYKNFVSYLSRNTWFGATLTKKDLGGKVIHYNWISMIAPSVVEYFVQMQSSLDSKEYKPNFILSIDSLTTKFEGLFREFCIRIKTPTSTNNKTTMQELYIHQLLKHPTIQKSFTEDDRLLFEYLFTKENGLNLRNNIAHCYFDYSDYSYGYFHLLLAALLRLGKYKFNIEQK